MFQNVLERLKIFYNVSEYYKIFQQIPDNCGMWLNTTLRKYKASVMRL